MRGAFLLWLVLLASGTWAQKDSAAMKQGYDLNNALINDVTAETWQSLDTIKTPAYENVYSRPLYSDPEASSFIIYVKKEVKEHKHATHAEHVEVLEGEAMMTLGDKSFKIKKGDLIFVPKDTWHSVKVISKTPLKVLSIQAPNFDGKDRIFKESK